MAASVAGMKIWLFATVGVLVWHAAVFALTYYAIQSPTTCRNVGGHNLYECG